MPLTSRLANGARVITQTMPGFCSAAAGIWLLNGVRHQGANQSGYAHLLEHLLFRGTDLMDGAELARRFETMGGLVNGYTGRELTALHGLVPGENVTELLALFIAMLTRPRFEPTVLATERQVILQEMAAVAANVDESLEEEAIAASWPDSPMGKPILGDMEALENATVDDLREYHAGLLQGSRLWVVAAGKVSHQDIEHIIAPLAELPKGKPPQVGTPRFRPVNHCRRRPVNQGHLLWLMPVPAATVATQSMILVANQVLAGSTASYLYRTLRVSEGLVYQVTSRVEQYSDCGLWQIRVSCPPEQLERCRYLVRQAMTELSAEGPAHSDVELAKRHLRARWLLDQDCPETVIERLIRESIYLNRHPTAGERLDSLEVVTGNDVRKTLGEAWQRHSALAWLPQDYGIRSR